MSVNVAEGYEQLGGERLWPAQQAYNGQVVQNWANNNDSVWNAFDSAVMRHGTPDNVWVMLCVFNNQVTIEETRQIVANVRSRAPAANIYITGQPLYTDPNACSLAGNGGPDKTDRIAQLAGAEPGLDVIYAGTLGPLSPADTAGDFTGCHANNDAGKQKLGRQFMDWFGN